MGSTTTHVYPSVPRELDDPSGPRLLRQRPAIAAGAVGREPEGHLSPEKAAMTVRRELLRADGLPCEETREQQVEEGRLGEHAAPRHAEDGHLADARDPQETPRVRRHP